MPGASLCDASCAMMPRPSAPPYPLSGGVLAIALALLAGLVRAHGLGWGLPQVYEEAKPLTLAWSLWGWGPDASFDWNPHFFRYPSLAVYLHWAAQAILYGVLRLVGVVHSSLAFRALYVTDPTLFYLAGRSVTVAFAVATVLVVYRFAARLGGPAAGVAAAGLLALNPVHIAASQVVEVDVPLTFFVVLALFYAVRHLEAPNWRTAIAGGAATGLAASVKYTGAFLLFPLIAAHLLAPRETQPRGSRLPGGKWLPRLALGLGAAFLAFALTSPFVLLDFEAFARDWNAEREHMRLGHFGLGASPTWLFYSRSLAVDALGWVSLGLLLLALVHRAAVRRERGALVLAAFIVPYGAVLASWAMQAERYLLPLLPTALILGWSEGVDMLRRLGRRRFMVPVAAGALLLAGAPLWVPHRAGADRARPDTRAAAKAWIEVNVPAGSFLVVESYGPDLFDPQDLWSLEPDLKDLVLDQRRGRPLYAVQPLLMFQVQPERSAAFYDLDLYRDADVVVTSSAIRSRYLADPVRFARHAAFYEALEKRFRRVQNFGPETGAGPEILIYRNPAHAVPFASRHPGEGSRPLTGRDPLPGNVVSKFYYVLGLNYETFGHADGAEAAYRLGLAVPSREPGLYSNLVMGLVRVLLARGRREEAKAFLTEAARGDMSAQDRDQIARLESYLRKDAAPAVR